jgi:hypothetical protein
LLNLLGPASTAALLPVSVAATYRAEAKCRIINKHRIAPPSIIIYIFRSIECQEERHG